jgi:hypothetical protein
MNLPQIQGDADGEKRTPHPNPYEWERENRQHLFRGIGFHVPNTCTEVDGDYPLAVFNGVSQRRNQDV